MVIYQRDVTAIINHSGVASRKSLHFFITCFQFVILYKQTWSRIILSYDKHKYKVMDFNRWTQSWNAVKAVVFEACWCQASEFDVVKQRLYLTRGVALLPLDHDWLDVHKPFWSRTEKKLSIFQYRQTSSPFFTQQIQLQHNGLQQMDTIWVCFWGGCFWRLRMLGLRTSFQLEHYSLICFQFRSWTLKLWSIKLWNIIHYPKRQISCSLRTKDDQHWHYTRTN